MRKRSIIAWMVWMALAATPAVGQVYKWVDENGKVNYGDKSPPRSKGARLLDEGGGMVSVVPGIPREELDRMRQRYEDERLRQLEREIDELRAREQARASAVPQTVYTEVYVPAYGYRLSGRFPGAGHPGRRPDRPIDRPRPPVRPRPLLGEHRLSLPG